MAIFKIFVCLPEGMVDGREIQKKHTTVPTASPRPATKVSGKRDANLKDTIEKTPDTYTIHM